MSNFISYARSGIMAVGVGVGAAVAADMVMDYAVRPIVGQPLNNAGLVAAAAGGFLLGASVAGLGAYAGDQVMDYLAGDDFLSHAFFYPVFAMNCRSAQTAAGALRQLVAGVVRADFSNPAARPYAASASATMSSGRNSTCGGGSCGK